jgi:hypothetical protein
MNSLLGHGLILLGAGAAALALPLAIESEGTDGPAALVVTTPTRSQARIAAAAESGRPDGEQLARLLQRELARVGCYGGAITGAWGSKEKSAMRGFLARVNASLPVDRPDDILLHLVQGEKQRVCTSPCAGQPAQGQADCRQNGPSAGAVTGPEQAQPTKVALTPDRQRALPARTVSDADEMRRVEENVENTAEPQARSEAARQVPGGEPAEQQSEKSDARRAPQHTAQEASAKKASRIVRLLLRNVERSLAPLGIH